MDAQNLQSPTHGAPSVDEEMLVDEPVHETTENRDTSKHDTRSLTSSDIKADPILSSLAKQQSAKSSSSGSSPSVAFKARPAPVTTRAEGLGPKMTKSAALRQGLDWAAMKPSRSESTKTTGFESTPGHKRTMSHHIASLAAPKTAPRQNRSSQLRSGEAGAEVIKKDMEAAAAENKAREKAERDARRKSVALPASLSVPSIAPKMNRSSLLRAGSMKTPGGTMAPPPVSRKPKTALIPTSAGNIKASSEQAGSEAGEEKGAKRRLSIASTLKSLAAPAIAPRMNKAALLRAPGSDSAAPSLVSSSSMSNLKPEYRKSLGPSAFRSTDMDMSTIIAKNTLGRRASVTVAAEPRPTKASLLRAGLGAKTAAKA